MSASGSRKKGSYEVCQFNMSPEHGKSSHARQTASPVAERAQFNRELGRLLAGWRAEAGLTQEWVADQLGCDQGKVSRLEGGRRTIDVESLVRILSVLGISLADEADAIGRIAKIGFSRADECNR